MSSSQNVSERQINAKRVLPSGNVYSVLMSVYSKDDPLALQESINSILCQTVPTDDFVIVCDGPLTRELDQILDYNVHIASQINLFRLEKNEGLGRALAIGLLKCKHDLVARMDSDDISVLNRCELELAAFEKDPDLDIVSASILEFNQSPHDGVAMRVLPETHEEIVKLAKRRNPLNHVTVMYRKECVLEAGNYQDFDRMEDYYLWIRMFRRGFKACNLSEALVYVRVGNGMQERRSGLSYVKSQLVFQKYLKETKYISQVEYLRNCGERIVGSLVPPRIRTALYARFLRTTQDDTVKCQN